MVWYDFYCPKCSREIVIQNPIDKEFPPLFCETCKVALKQKLPFMRPLTHTTGGTIADRIRQEAAHDVKQINKGNDKKRSEFLGD